MPTMPVLFIGHGNPLNALEENIYSNAWIELGKQIPRPKIVLVISAHWYVAETSVTAMASPRTIHDFGGFPRALHEFEYPARGAPDFAAEVQSRLRPLNVGLDQSWGLDHGAWSVLCRLFPKADVPVVQLSIDETQPASFHYDLGVKLTPLRDEGILILGSGNLVHNLHTYAWGRHPVEPFDWAVRFEKRARELIVAGDHAPLISYEQLGRDAQLSIPTPEHYLPLLYVLGARRRDDRVTFTITGVDGGSVSMFSVTLG